MARCVGTARLFFLAMTASCAAIPGALAQGAFTITDAIQQAVRTHPGVNEPAANRRATEAEMRQTQSTLLPQVRLEYRNGPEWFRQDITPAPLGNNERRWGNDRSVVVRQLLFDGFASIHDIWRQTARVDAASHRVTERTELIALDAAEAYIDVVRYTRLVAIARQNVDAHQRILTNVRARYQGGRAGEGDLQQVTERVEAAQASMHQFRLSLDESRAKFRRAVGLEAHNLRWPGRLPAMPRSKDESLAVALRHNPTIRAAQSDADAAKHAFHQTAGAFVPTVTLEGRAAHGRDANNYTGHRDEYSGKLVVSWDVFRGGQDVWRRTEMAERYIESTQRHARLQRDAFEILDKAWAARTLTSDRIAALNRQIEADRRVIAAYTKEYELGQRSLVDLLNAENQLFTAQVSHVSTQGVAVFADFQLLAAMGKLLEYLKEPHPIESMPIDPVPVGIFPSKLAPIHLTLPKSGSEPLSVAGQARSASASAAITTSSVSPTAANVTPVEPQFSDRWASVSHETSPLVELMSSFRQFWGKVPASSSDDPVKTDGDVAPVAAMSFAPEPLFPNAKSFFQRSGGWQAGTRFAR